MYYQWFLDVEVMIFLGFGFLMTFLRRYSYSAVAFNFFISAFVMIYSVLVLGFVQQVCRSLTPVVLFCSRLRCHMRSLYDCESLLRLT